MKKSELRQVIRKELLKEDTYKRLYKKIENDIYDLYTNELHKMEKSLEKGLSIIQKVYNIERSEVIDLTTGVYAERDIEKHIYDHLFPFDKLKK
jgi:hypothetical protein